MRHNCHELLAEFQSDVAKDGRIDLHLEGDMSSSVRYLNNTETGEITADQEAYIDTLLAQYNMTECNANKDSCNCALLPFMKIIWVRSRLQNPEISKDAQSTSS